jgi:UDP-4-amino-4,6-dideoxy-N-acetyl-beta-L-altrosamine transaminase
MKIIPYAKQEINFKDIKNITKTLRSDFITQGPEIEKFEKNISNFTGGSFSVAVNSATSGLHISCLALGLKKGDYLWTSPNSFVASSNCGLYCGAKVDFVDIGEKDFNICPKKLKEKLEKTPKKKIPKIIVLVHFGGNPCDLKTIRKLSKKYKFKIIEDASHAIGAKYKDSNIGDCKYSDLCVFSFHPVKIITTGEGGVVTTNNKKYFNKLFLLRNHGIIKSITQFHKRKNSNWLYNQTSLGFNYRMNDIQASLGSSQLERIKKFVKIRNNFAKKYVEKLKKLPISFQKIEKDNLSSYHLFIIVIKDNRFSRNKLFYKLKSKGINSNVHYIPIYKHSFYKQLGFKNTNFKITEKYYKSCLSLPIFPGLKNKDFNIIINEIKKYFKDV